MNLESLLKIIEVVVAVLLVISILLQQKEGGLGTTFGGGSGGGDSFGTKKGMESILSKATIVFVVIFIVNSIAIAVINA